MYAFDAVALSAILQYWRQPRSKRVSGQLEFNWAAYGPMSGRSTHPSIEMITVGAHRKTNLLPLISNALLLV